MILRALAFVVGGLLITGVVYLGIWSGTHPNLVPWFGIASAIGAPIALSLLAFGILPSNAGTIRKLAKVPQIELLIQRAETEEERLSQLKRVRSDLETLIEREAQRKAALDHLDRLRKSAERTLVEFEALEKELAQLDTASDDTGIAKEIILRLRERIDARKRGDIVFEIHGRTYIIERSLFRSLPFNIGPLMMLLFTAIESFQNRRSS
ncbi:hypothetical protein [Lewinella sp. JB7]|uniref:hypothetical protein n=1 Tax=Lewinella sp. JB7 TaxID=2962887 RepID=UPI0020C9AC86|nr:hypothetical protein [Lewinella sp. JB7]MCP9237915.1 hypothetical protein [Lewinella sp. JB7]